MTNNVTYTAQYLLDLASAKEFEALKDICFYDWFCKDTSLATKSKTLINKFKQISTSTKFDLAKTSLLFKNNCPGVGTLYDDFRIIDAITRDVMYTVIPSSGFTSNKGKSEVWGKENNFEQPLITGTWKEVKEFF